MSNCTVLIFFQYIMYLVIVHVYVWVTPMQVLTDFLAFRYDGNIHFFESPIFSHYKFPVKTIRMRKAYEQMLWNFDIILRKIHGGKKSFVRELTEMPCVNVNA